MTDIFAALKAPFSPEKISWRVGATTADKKSGLALAYIDARDVMQRLDEAVGAGNWQNRYPHANGKTVCEIGINIRSENLEHETGWIWKANGAGDTDVEAEKGALSDAFKRAAVMWGIGQYLYAIESAWVAIEPMGRSFKIKDSEMPKLRALLGEKPKPNTDKPSVAYSLALEAMKKVKNETELSTWAKDTKRVIETLPNAEQDKLRKEYGDFLKTILKTKQTEAA